MKNILIVCAMEKEAKSIANKLNLIKTDENIYKNENINLLISGIGKQRTAISVAEFLCVNKKPDLIINKWVNITRCYNYEWEIPGEEKYVMLDARKSKVRKFKK